MASQYILIQHTCATTPGVALEWLTENKVPFTHVKVHKGDPLPTPNQGDSLIVCGGGVHVDQDDKYPWLRDEKKFIEKNIQLGNKIVGLCLGGQLCAHVLGARVAPHDEGWEVGWADVDLHAHPDLPGFESKQQMKFSQYHRYIFETPKDATILAVNNWWSPQAYLWNKQILGFQFHPERDLNGNHCCAMEKDLPTEGWTQPSSTILELGQKHQPQSAAWFKKVLSGFLKKDSTT